MLNSYLPAIVFVGLGTVVGVAFALLNTFFGPRRAVAHKSDPYECGLPSEIQQNFRFGISFYLIAMLFILFDIEVLFLYPWAVIIRDLRDNFSMGMALLPMGFFLLVLVVGLVYEWKKGALDLE